MRCRLAAAALAVALLASPAAAQVAAPAQGRAGQADDEVVLTIAREGWVETQTARVQATVDMALTAAQLADARGRLDDRLKRLSDAAPWRVVAMHRLRDDAGLERWRAVAEARLPEAALAGLADRAKAASEPGVQVAVTTVDFTPTLAEREAVRMRLRAEIYEAVETERAALAKAFAGRPFRVGRIDFTQSAQPLPRPFAANARSAQAPEAALAAAPDDGVSVSVKLTVAATVVLLAAAP